MSGTVMATRSSAVKMARGMAMVRAVPAAGIKLIVINLQRDSLGLFAVHFCKGAAARYKRSYSLEPELSIACGTICINVHFGSEFHSPSPICESWYQNQRGWRKVG